MSLLEVSGLTKSFPVKRDLLFRVTESVHAAEDVSFSVDTRETVALVGESGAGKSTLGRLILRIVEPDRGSVVLDGVDVLAQRGRNLRELRRRMQMIFQDPHSSLDPRVTVGESIGEPLLVHDRMPRAERLQRSLGLLERVGLGANEYHRYPGQLSGGQLQRVAIARALTLSPSLIVCDEPTSALDVSVQAQVINLMRRLQAEEGMAYLFISHNLALVRAVADRICVMQHGRIVDQGDVEYIFEHSTVEYTRSLVDAIPTGGRRGAASQDRCTSPEPSISLEAP